MSMPIVPFINGLKWLNYVVFPREMYIKVCVTYGALEKRYELPSDMLHTQDGLRKFLDIAYKWKAYLIAEQKKVDAVTKQLLR